MTTNTSTSVLAEKVEAIPVSQPGLMAFEESANVVKNDSSHNVSIERSISNPFPVDVPRELLERSFPVATIAWNSVMTTQIINFPGAFLSVPTITNVLNRFAWMRAGVHIEIKMQSTPYHQGSLLVGWLPCAGTAPPTTLQMISGYDCTVLSASTQDSCSYDIPYLHPCDWITSSISTTANADICSLFITQLNPLLTTASTIPLSIPLLVFASFKNIEVTGYQSQMKTGPRFSKNTEAQKKSEHGEDTKSIVTTASKILRKIPIVGDVYSPIADLVNTFAGDLSKPTTTETPCSSVHPYYSDVNHGAGLTQATTLSLYPNPQISQAPKMFGMETSHMGVSDIARRPLLYDQITFNGTVVNWEVAVDPFTTGAVITGRDYLNSMSTLHRFWRGSVKYLIHFCMPAFFSCRVRFSIDFMGGGTPNNFGDLMTRFIDVKGDTWEEVTVPFMNRTTWCDRTATSFVPYFRIFQVTAIVGSGAPATPVMYVNIFRSGGEDIQFAGVLNVGSFALEPTKARIGYNNQYNNQMHLGKRFTNQFPCLNKGVTQSVEKGQCMVETSGSVSDILKRHQNTSALPYYPGTTGNNLAPLGFLSQFFMFWRGGRILRHIHYESTTYQSGFYLMMGNATDWNIENAWAPAYSAPTMLFQPEAVHVPYYSAQPYYPLQQGNNFTTATAYVSPPVDALLRVNTDTGNATTLAGADDHVWLFLVPWGNATVTLASNHVTKPRLPPKTTVSSSAQT